MFRDSEAFSGFSTDNIDKAKVFYEEILGLDVSVNTMGILTLNLATGGTVIIYPKPDHVAADYTVLNFPVEDIDETVEKLIALGTEFEQYDTEYLKTDGKGVARSNSPEKGPSIAWFKDPAGNILSVLED